MSPNLINKQTTMTVAQLLAELSRMDPDRLVILQKDAEGNAYSPLASCCEGTYYPQTTWAGQATPETLTDHNTGMPIHAPPSTHNARKALILVPIN